ncbi:MAG: Smr/MutS family protein [Hyphomicrobiaceae bacterium]
MTRDPAKFLRQRRALTAEEADLWARAMHATTPLEQRHVHFTPVGKPPPDAPPSPPPAAARSEREQRRTRPAPPPPKPTAAIARETGRRQPAAPQTIDRKDTKRIAKGRIEIQARLDLHGMRQDEAHAALLRFVQSCRAQDMRVVLVITGKGGAEDVDRGPVSEGAGRGILKRNVPRWLAQAPFSAHVSGIGSASATHGGQGAIYVRLRRPGKT